MINDKLVGLNELAGELKQYWQGFSHKYHDVEAIEVIVIDLSVGEHVCDS